MTDETLKDVLMKIIESYIYYPYEWKLDLLIEKYEDRIFTAINKDRKTEGEEQTCKTCKHYTKNDYGPMCELDPLATYACMNWKLREVDERK